MSKRLMEVRDRFIKVLNDPKHLNASSREIASSFLETHRTEIAAESWDEVTITGLVAIMGGLRHRRPVPEDGSGAQSLFASFAIDPIVVVRVTEEGRGTVEKNKDIGSLTLAEALDYLNRHSKERAANATRVREWRRLIKRVKPFMTSQMTLAEGLAAAEAHDTAKGKKAAS
jgi:hypothetical protein